LIIPNAFIDPFFSLSFLIDSWFPGALDAVFQITFISALLLFWLCVYHGLRQNDRRLIFYLPKILLVGSIWLSMIIVAVWQEIEEVNDPTFSYKLDTEHFYVIKFDFTAKRNFYFI
jgi:Wnt-binding factor required for Wnt secretion